MKPNEYFNQLSENEKEAYSERVGSSSGYLRRHLLAQKGPRKTPKPGLLISLVEASEGQVSLDEAIDYFLVQPVKTLAAASAGSTDSMTNNNLPRKTHSSPNSSGATCPGAAADLFI